MRTLNLSDKNWIAVVSLYLIGLMWVLPFLSPRHQLPIPSFYSELTAFVLGMLAMCALWKKAVWQDFQLPRIILLPFGILCIILLQLALGMVVYPQMALIAMQYLLWACLLMVLGHRLREALGWEKFAATLAAFLVLGGLINFFMAVLAYAGVKSLWLFPGLSGSAFGNLGQPNHFANYMALATGSLIYLFISKRLPRAVFVTGAVAFLAMLALSASRSAWLYLLALAALAALKQLADPSRETRTLTFTCLALLPAFALIQTGLHWLLELWGGGAPLMVNERFFQLVSGTSVRLTLWRDALQMFSSHPCLGAGYGQFPWHSFLLAGTHAAGEFAQPAEHAHNLLFQVFAEMGLLGGVLLIGLAWRWIRSAVRETFTLERWWMWALLAVLGIHSLLEYPLWYSYFLGIAAVLLGAGEAAVLRSGFSRIGRPALAAMLGLGFYSAIGLEQSYASLETWVNRAMAHRIKDSDLAMANQALLRLHKESLLTPYVELMYAISLTPDRAHMNDQLYLTKRALQFAPVREVAYHYAELLEMKGDREASLKQFELSRAAYPEGARAE